LPTDRAAIEGDSNKLEAERAALKGPEVRGRRSALMARSQALQEKNARNSR
jgi:Skp family chaperone for outer membrane proteins